MTADEIIQDIADLVGMQEGKVVGHISHPHYTGLFFKLFATAHAQNMTATVLTGSALRDAVIEVWGAEERNLDHCPGYMGYLDDLITAWDHWRYAVDHIGMYTEAIPGT